MELGTLVSPRLIFPALAGADARAILRTLAEAVGLTGEAGGSEELLRRLEEREALGSTAIGGGVALPHCKVSGLHQVKVAVGVAAAPEGVDFRAADGLPVRVLFVVLSPETMPAAHLKALAAISRWVRTPGHVAGLLARRDAAAMHEYLLQERGIAGAVR